MRRERRWAARRWAAGLVLGLVTLLVRPWGGGLAAPAAQPAPAHGAWERVGDLPGWRYLHAAARLADGRVLVACGQVGPTPEAWASTALFEPGAARWVAAGNLAFPRIRCTLDPLPDGGAWLVGGYLPGDATRPAATERFDPGSGRWSLGPELGLPRSHHVSAWLPDGGLLVAGGLTALSEPTASVERCRLDGACEALAPMSVPRYFHAAAVLADGSVLVVGGQDERDGEPLDSAEIYEPATGAWRSAGRLGVAPRSPIALRLADGRVLLLGSVWLDGGGSRGVASLFDPVRQAWTAAAPPTTPQLHAATLLADGRVLVSGGAIGPYAGSAAATLYDPLTDTWSPVAEMHTPRFRHTATRLAGGRVLVAGGEPDRFTAEVFSPPPRLDTRLFLPLAAMPSTGLPVALTEGPRRDWQPALSPDGQRLAYVSDDPGSGTSQVKVLSLATGETFTAGLPDRIVETPTFLSPSLVALSGWMKDLGWFTQLLDLNGGLPGSAAACGGNPRRPSYRPDLAMHVADAERDGQRDIVRFDQATGTCTRLTDDPAADVGPSLAPDGRWLVFRSERDGNSEIYRMDIDGSQVRRLTRDPAHDGYATVSPDGGHVLFQSARGGRDGIYLMAADGGEPRPLLTGPARYATPRFTPDGCGLVYASDAANPGQERWRVYLWARALCPSGG